jgi:hypothetical protein
VFTHSMKKRRMLNKFIHNSAAHKYHGGPKV